MRSFVTNRMDYKQLWDGCSCCKSKEEARLKRIQEEKTAWDNRHLPHWYADFRAHAHICTDGGVHKWKGRRDFVCEKCGEKSSDR